MDSQVRSLLHAALFVTTVVVCLTEKNVKNIYCNYFAFNNFRHNDDAIVMIIIIFKKNKRNKFLYVYCFNSNISYDQLAWLYETVISRPTWLIILSTTYYLLST